MLARSSSARPCPGCSRVDSREGAVWGPALLSRRETDAATRMVNLTKHPGRVVALTDLDPGVAPGGELRLPRRAERGREVDDDPPASGPAAPKSRGGGAGWGSSRSGATTWSAASAAGPDAGGGTRPSSSRMVGYSTGVTGAQDSSGRLGNAAACAGRGHRWGDRQQRPDRGGHQLLRNRPTLTPAVPGAIEAISVLAGGPFEDRVHLVSKAGPTIAAISLQWLSESGFFTTTGLDPTRVHFVRDRAEKDAVCAGLRVTHFVDDRLSVLNGMPSVPHLYLFTGGMCEARLPRPADVPTGITAVHDWPTLHRLLTEGATGR